MSIRVKVFDTSGQLVGPLELARVEKTDAEWRRSSRREQYQVARGKGTERPFCGTLLDNKQHGVYTCVCCGLPLFTSDAKFNSGTGWPSFFQPVAAENVVNDEDRSYGMRPRRDPVRPLRRAPRPRVRGRPAADRPALLREFRVAGVHRQRRSRDTGRSGRRVAGWLAAARQQVQWEAPADMT